MQFNDKDFKSYFDSLQKSTPFNGEEFQKFILDRINDTTSSFSRVGREKSDSDSPFNNFHFDSLDEFIKSTMERSIPDFNINAQPSSYKSLTKPEIFETYDSIILKFPLVATNDSNLPEIYINSYELQIVALNSSTISIPLPKPVLAEKATIDYRDGIVEVQVLKKEEEPFIKLNVLHKDK